MVSLSLDGFAHVEPDPNEQVPLLLGSKRDGLGVSACPVQISASIQGGLLLATA